MTHNYFFLASSHDLLKLPLASFTLLFRVLTILGILRLFLFSAVDSITSSSSSSTAAAAAAYTPSSGVCQQLYCRNVYEKRVRIHLFWSDQVPQSEEDFYRQWGESSSFSSSAPVHLIAYVLCGQRLVARKVHILRFGSKCVLIK